MDATNSSGGDDARDEPPAWYEIRVRGVLDSRWAAWFEGLQITSDQAGQTTIAGPVADQAALHGLLAKVRDLGLPLIWVRHINPNQQRPRVRAGAAAPAILPQLPQGDYFGRTVNLAARIAEYARPGKVLVSQEVVDAADAAPVSFVEIGPWS